MENALEACMIVSLCMAVAVFMHRTVKGGIQCAAWERICIITIGIGFVIGAISKAASNVLPWTFVLYIAGADLCYTAALFSFPKKQEAEIKGDGHE